MVRTRKLAGIALAGALVIGGVTASSVAASASTTCGGGGSGTSLPGTLGDGATYLIQCPPGTWNGTLLLYSHGYVTPGSNNPAMDVGDPATGAYLLAHGFALAGSSYATTGWAIQQALQDQISTLDIFDNTYGTPARTIAWGHSLGGIITAGLIQDYPNRFNAALPMCGVLSGGVATWNTALDAEFAFQQLIDPSVQIVNITKPTENFGNAEAGAIGAQATAAGRARLALVAALGDTPGWFNPASPEPAPTDYAAQEVNQFEWATQVTFAFAFALRAELEGRAGGNVSWNTGVNYFADLAKSADFKEVVALYHAAGLSLTKDLLTLTRAPRISADLSAVAYLAKSADFKEVIALYHQAGLSLTKDLLTLNRTQRISADPSAVAYLAKYISFDGDISFPVLSLHTTGDGLVVPENEQAYRSVVDRAGNGRLLRQLFVARAGHCTFTPAETITALDVLLNRLDTGHWNVPDPATLNDEASALGALNVAPPAFTSFQPTQYPRPFDLPRER